MHPFFAENFDRELACSEKDWLAWLPQALGGYPYQLVANALTASIDAGQLRLSWRGAAPRGTAPMQPGRLLVSFRFIGLDALQRYRVMKRFDLYTQRGSG